MELPLYELVFENAYDPIIVFDADGKSCF